MTADEQSPEIDPDMPMPLSKAAKLFSEPVSTLRIGRNRGMLDTFRLGNREYTTLRAIKRMVERCQEREKARLSSLRPCKGESPSGPSGTTSGQEALDAALMIAKELRESGKAPARKEGRSGSRHRQ